MNFQSVNVSLIRKQNLRLVMHYRLQASSDASRTDLMDLNHLNGANDSSLANSLIAIDLKPICHYSMGAAAFVIHRFPQPQDFN